MGAGLDHIDQLQCICAAPTLLVNDFMGIWAAGEQERGYSRRYCSSDFGDAALLDRTRSGWHGRHQAEGGCTMADGELPLFDTRNTADLYANHGSGPMISAGLVLYSLLDFNSRPRTHRLGETPCRGHFYV